MLVKPIEIMVDLTDIVGADHEAVRDLICERVGIISLGDFTYPIVPARCTDLTLCFAVIGNASDQAAEEDKDDDDD